MNEQTTFTFRGASKGVRRALPLALAGGLDGLVFGVFARQAGLDVVQAVLMSSLVCAGSAQYVALTLWAYPLPMIPVILTTLVINARHVLMGASLQDWFARRPAWQTYSSAFVLSDESWALTTYELERGGRDLAFLLGSGICLAIGWITGTSLGFLASGALTDPTRWGLDFAFAAVFIALLTSLRRGSSDLLPWCTAGVVAVVTYRWLPHPWYILIGGTIGSLAGAWVDTRLPHRSPVPTSE